MRRGTALKSALIRTISCRSGSSTWRPSTFRSKPWHHAVWGLETAKTSVFAPPALVGPIPFADLRAMMDKAQTALEAFTADEVNGWAGKEWTFRLVLESSASRRRPSFPRSRYRTSIFMP